MGGTTIKQFAAEIGNSQNEAFRKRNPHLFKTPQCVKDHPAPAPAPDAPRTPVAVSTDEAKLNKTERAYLAYVRCLGFAWIGIQNVTLKLGDDCRYTPDLVCVDTAGNVHVREVKGFFRDDAKVKIKVAARQFPWMIFQVVRKTKLGWEHINVKP